MHAFFYFKQMDPFNPNNQFGQSSGSYDPFNTHNYEFHQYSNEANHFSDHSSGSFNPFEGQYPNANNQFGQSSNPYEGQYPNINNQFGQSFNPFEGQYPNINNQFGQSFNPFEGQYHNINNQFGQSSNPSEDQYPNTNDEHMNGEEIDEQVEDEEEDKEIDEQNLREWQAVSTTCVYTLAYYYDSFLKKEPCRTSIRTGSILIQEIMEGNDNWCYQDFRMNKVLFVSLCNILVERYGLVPTRGMSQYEAVGIFLMTVAHGTSNRVMQEMFNHSGETISRHFHSVLEALCRMARDYVKPASNYNAGSKFHKPQQSKYYPHFKVMIIVICKFN